MKKIGKLRIGCYRIGKKGKRRERSKDKKDRWEIWKKRISKVTVFLVITVLAGVAVGALFAGQADGSFIKRMDFLFFGSYEIRKGSTWFEIFSTSLFSSSLYAISVMLAGASIWGAVVAPMAVFLKGFGLGITMGYLFITKGISGIIFTMAVVLPGAFLSTIGLIYMAEKGMKYSVELAKKGIPLKNKTTKGIKLREYLVMESKGFAFFGVAGVVDMLLSKIFIQIF